VDVQPSVNADLVLDDRVKIEMTASFHRVGQQRDQHLQPLAADAVSSPPQDDRRLCRSLVVNPVACHRFGIGYPLATRQPDRMLAMAS
jgi:hypothetical protein